MAYQASHMYARVTARKARPLADLVRGLNASRALDVLHLNPRRAASLFRAVIQSALANAGQKQGVNLNQLVIRQIYVDQGPMQKRGRPVARGRFHRIQKKTSHLHVVLDEPPAAVPPPEKPARKKGGEKKGGKPAESAKVGGRV